MRTISDLVTLRAFCLEQAVKVYETNVRAYNKQISILDAAKSFEEYIAEDIELPDHAHYPDTFLTVNNNNCPCVEEEEDDEDNGLRFN